MQILLLGRQNMNKYMKRLIKVQINYFIKPNMNEKKNKLDM